MSFIENFATQVREGYINQDQIAFSNLITIDVSNYNVSQLAQELVHTNENQAQQIVNAVLEDTSYALSECIVNFLQVLRYLYNPDIDFVFETFATFYSSLIPVFNGSDTFYQVPFIKAMSTNLVQLAIRVDNTGLVGKARKANTAARLLSKIFHMMLSDRSPIDTSKRQGIFHITNLAFKVYFKLNSMRMCQTFINNIRTGGLELNMFPISQQVTYNYYLGRYSLDQGKLKQAQECLLFAFEHCHASQWHNKRVILHYLIPTRLILGYLPPMALLDKYQLADPYMNLVRTMRSGDIKSYLAHIEQYFDYFYKHLTYLLLKERGVVLVWRCLIKNLHTQKQNLGPANHVVEFADILKAFELSTALSSLTFVDIENILVSLISQGYVRGYIQHSQQKLILSKMNPFPSISHVRIITERYNEASVNEHLDTQQPSLPKEIQQLIDE